MSGVCYGGETLNGMYIGSCISYASDYIYEVEGNNKYFARVERVFRGEEDWTNGNYGKIAIVSYLNNNSESPDENGFSMYTPIISFILSPVTDDDIPTNFINWDDEVIKAYGKENFDEALKILFMQTELAFRQGIRCEDGIVKYTREA